MKKSTKIILIVAAVMLAGGGLLTLLAASLGGGRQFQNMIMAGELDFDIPGTDDLELVIDMQGVRIVDSGSSASLGISSASEVPEAPEVPEISDLTEKPEKPGVSANDAMKPSPEGMPLKENIREIDMELGAGEIIFKQSPDENIYIEEEGKWNFTTKVEGEKLILSASGEVFLDFFADGEELSTGKAVVYLPRKTYDSVDIELGAGVVTMGEIAADTVSVMVGAGEMKMESIVAEEFDIEVAAGSCDIEHMAVKELDADIAMGEFDGKGLVEQELEAQVGMGEITLGLEGKEEDYDYSVDCGAGEVHIGSRSYEGIAGEDKRDNPGNKRINVDCGMGSVEIKFEE